MPLCCDAAVRANPAAEKAVAYKWFNNAESLGANIIRPGNWPSSLSVTYFFLARSADCGQVQEMVLLSRWFVRSVPPGLSQVGSPGWLLASVSRQILLLSVVKHKVSKF